MRKEELVVTESLNMDLLVVVIQRESRADELERCAWQPECADQSHCPGSKWSLNILWAQ